MTRLCRQAIGVLLIAALLGVPAWSGALAQAPSRGDEDQGLREVLEIAQSVLFPAGVKAKLSRWAYAPVTLAVNASPGEEALLRDALRQFSTPLGGDLRRTTDRTRGSMPVFFLNSFEEIVEHTDVIANCMGNKTLPELIQATVDGIRSAKNDLFVAPAEKNNVIGCAPIVLLRDHPERHRKLLMRWLAISLGLRGTTAYESVTTNNKRDDRVSPADGILLHVVYHLARPGMIWPEVNILIE